MDRTLFNRPSINIHFNLRTPKSQTPTTIYAVVYMNGRQYKFTTNRQVYPHQWDYKKEECKIAPTYTEHDNQNNMSANLRIWKMKEAFQNFLLYLCSNSEADACQEMKSFFSSIAEQPSMNPVKTTNMKAQKENALLWLKQQISEEYDIPQNRNDKGKLKGTGATYLSQLGKIEEYVSTLQGISYIGWEDITSQFLQGYYDYLTNTTENKVKTNNRHIECFIQRLNKYAVPAGKMKKTDVLNLTYRKLKSKEEDYQIALREKEIDLLRKFECSTPKDTTIRDMLLLCCTTGQRFSDYTKVLSHVREEGESMYIDLIREKKSSSVKVPVLFKLAKELILKYKDNIPTIDNTTMNRSIKQIAKAAGITGKETIGEQRGKNQKPVPIVKERWELIQSHTGRRTFATMLKLRDWDVRKIAEYGGWKDTEMVEHYCKLSAAEYDIYKHTPKEERLKLIDEYEQADNHNQPVQPKVSTLDELLQVLFREQDLFYLKDLRQNKVDISTLDKTIQIKKHLEDINHAQKHKQLLQEYYQAEPKMLKQRLAEILRATTLIDTTYNLSKMVITILQKLGVDCVYADDTYKYPGKAAREAYLLMITKPDGGVIIR